MGFKYDSSITSFSPFNLKGIKNYQPYQYPGIKIIEVPLTIQDTTLFCDLDYTSEKAFNTLKDLIDKITAIGGVAMVNTHPSITSQHLEFYKKLLQYLSHQETILVTTLNQAVDLFKSNKQYV